MNRTLLLRILAAGIAVTTITLVADASVWAHGSPPSADNASTYTVRSGDSLFGIATKLGVTLPALLQANAITASTVIQAGDTLVVPAGATASPTPRPAPGPTTSYVVKVGDGLASIAAAHGVKLATFLNANSLIISSVIHPGQVLQVPTASAPIPTGLPPSEVLVTYLQGQVGKPYKFFTAGPETFDCSGLVVAGYRQIGVALPHQSRALSKVGTAVDWRTSPIKAGDLVFMLSSNDPTQIGHVGIALSETTWIQAAGEGIPVRIRPMPTADKIVEVRRVL